MTDKHQNQDGIAHILGIVLFAVVILVIFSVFVIVKNHTTINKVAQKIGNSQKQAASSDVSWNRGEGGIWIPTATPPDCPKPPIFATPVDISLASAILYPGQVRTPAFKPQGGFRFDNQPNNSIDVTVPMDAKIVRGTRAFRNGENQYGFEFIAPCGIWYSFGHMLKLSPKFLAIANKLPLIGDFAKTQFFDVTPAVNVKKGEVMATEVGYAKTKNVFVEWTVLDLRHKNGFTIRPDWAKYSQDFDEYGVCWLDMLPADDSARAKALPGGDSISGKMSDYCK